MKRFPVLFAVLCVATSCMHQQPARGVTATLSFTQINNVVQEETYVTMDSGASSWNGVTYWCDKYGGPPLYHDYTFSPVISGPGTFHHQDPYAFAQLDSGDYFLYAVAHGSTRTGPYTSSPWDVSTSSHDITVP